MKIPIRILNNSYVAEALVEIPSNIINHFPIDTDGYLTIDHVRPGAPTGVMGYAPLIFKEQSIHPTYLLQGITSLDQPIDTSKIREATLLNLGFQKRGLAKWWHLLFGEDLEHNWMDFDPTTDNLTTLIPKLFKEGFYQGQKKVRWEIKKALDIPLI